MSCDGGDGGEQGSKEDEAAHCRTIRQALGELRKGATISGVNEWRINRERKEACTGGETCKERIWASKEIVVNGERD